MQYIHSNSPKTKIVLVGVLPRGAQYWLEDQAWIWPNRYTAAIAAVNEGYNVRRHPFPFMFAGQGFCHLVHALMVW